MKCIKMKFGLFFLVLLSMSAEGADYCNLLWFNNTTPTVNPLNINVDGNETAIASFSLNAGGASTLVYAYKEGVTDGKNIDGVYRYWIQYPEGWQISEGLKYRIISDLDASGTQSTGVRTVVTPAIVHTWRGAAAGCSTQNSSYTFDMTTISGMKIEINRESTFPGSYSIALPIKVAYEENKGNFPGTNGSGWTVFPDTMKAYTPVNSENVNITVSSKCDVGEKSLNVNMGDNITPEEAKAGVEKQIYASLSCNASAEVSLSLKGVDILDGIDSKTKCGSGSCTLSFDNGSSTKTLEVNQGSYQIPITVRFQDTNAVAGSFTGSAVLSVDIL